MCHVACYMLISPSKSDPRLVNINVVVKVKNSVNRPIEKGIIKLS